MSYIEFFSAIHNQLGMMRWPLTLLSVLMLMLIIERLVFFLLNSKANSGVMQSDLYQLSLDDDAKLDTYLQQHVRDKGALSQGICMLIGHRQFAKPLREEAVSLWLQEKRRQFMAGLRLLQIIGVLSPLLGLLGTVLGLIEMFRDVAATQGAVTPSQLADGLGLAMATTAAGLLIAVPAIACSQLFSLWANRKLDTIEYLLNHFNLHLIGLSVDKIACPPSTTDCGHCQEAESIPQQRRQQLAGASA
ncbi:biopolymer transport protein exbB1 [Shewanella sp. NFH-SH190041]|uniref:MotA/TolQ/ExbB proton channel family protein n=1 Tax=Shewanella sp. NFH-SH190041 TaxID=2950245 RepID=UPI0021C271F9|nr:MotA/TolQ/ExbB proton channel family protein [Shewanella sp. NFH-SH190041]BDM62973.1 biopolymer transport protein exbB1 [Shewanella sp. NFH-SH190041]